MQAGRSEESDREIKLHVYASMKTDAANRRTERQGKIFGRASNLGGPSPSISRARTNYVRNAPDKDKLPGLMVIQWGALRSRFAYMHMRGRNAPRRSHQSVRGRKQAAFEFWGRRREDQEVRKTVPLPFIYGKTKNPELSFDISLDSRSWSLPSVLFVD